ncbi:MAG: hypothetical protein HQ592_05930, partial [Planctomycetes bacterium]|nr:hypothetical protein [Planctomycetota bacterium]
MKCTCVLGIILTIACVGLSYGAIPQFINYQGKLWDTSSSTPLPMDGQVEMIFRLYDAETAGDLLFGPETQNVTVNEGIFNVILGSATPGGIPPDVFDSPNVWLQVQAGGETLVPRQRLTSVGWAYKAKKADDADHAANADLLDGLDSLSFAPAAHNHDDRYYTKAHVDALEARIASLEALLAGVSRAGSDITFSAVNVQIVNGTGSTDGAVNGVGNLIVGYNEERGDATD